MQAHAARSRQSVVERVTDERVRESKTDRRLRDIGHDARDDRLVEHVEEVVLRDLDDVREDVEGELASRTDARTSTPIALLGQVPQSAEITSRTLCGIRS